MKSNKITKEDFSVEKEGDVFIAYAHFAPFYFGDIQRGKHKFMKSRGKTKEEAIKTLVKGMIKDLGEL